MSGPDILCLGEPLIEFVAQEDGRYLRGFGGDTSNAAIAAARQGASVGYITALGQDQFGDALIELWSREGVDASMVRRAEAPTGVYFVDPDPAERRFTYYRASSAAAGMKPDDLDLNGIAAAETLHLSGITLAVSESMRETAFAAMDAARSVSLDTNLRLKLWSRDMARETLSRVIPKATHLITSLEDCQELWPVGDADQVIDMAQSMGAGTVLVTMGADGCRMAVGERRETIPAAPASPVDSTGAGDSFAGSFHAWRLALGDPFAAARRAATVAAGTVSGYGAIDPIPTREEVLALVG